MGFDYPKYEKVKSECTYNLKNEHKTPYCYMQEYEKSIHAEDYESAKAITDCLKPFGYHTIHTHRNIFPNP